MAAADRQRHRWHGGEVTDGVDGLHFRVGSPRILPTGLPRP